MSQYILDTNILFNMEADLGLGKTTKTILENLIKILPKAKNNNENILLPPTIVSEMEVFFKDQDDSLLQEFLTLITVCSPASHDLSISGSIFNSLIDDYRSRSFKGMKVAEEEILETAKIFMGKETLPQKEFQISVGKIVSRLRERFRNATRTGTVDSRADFDLIALAKESKGTLISTDEGVILWARKIGVIEMSPQIFGKKMKAYL